MKAIDPAPTLGQPDSIDTQAVRDSFRTGSEPWLAGTVQRDRSGWCRSGMTVSHVRRFLHLDHMSARTGYDSDRCKS